MFIEVKKNLATQITETGKWQHFSNLKKDNLHSLNFYLSQNAFFDIRVG